MKTKKLSHDEIAAMLQAEVAAERELNDPAVGYVKVGNRYKAQLGVGKAKVYLGYYRTAAEATAAYRRAKAQRELLRAGE